MFQIMGAAILLISIHYIHLDTHNGKNQNQDCTDNRHLDAVGYEVAP